MWNTDGFIREGFKEEVIDLDLKKSILILYKFKTNETIPSFITIANICAIFLWEGYSIYIFIKLHVSV